MSHATLHRHPERGSSDEAAIHAILDATAVCHVGFAADGQPFVIPTLFARIGQSLVLHGSAASRMMRHLATGVPACVTVTCVDGLVLARAAFKHSINYRSAVCFGTARLVEDREEKLAALEAIMEHVLPGRWSEARPPNDNELKATAVIEFTIQEASAKVRKGPPLDAGADLDLPLWAGVLPQETVAAEPVADERSGGRELPGSVRRRLGR